jgi:hypothetical protein
MVVHAHLAFQIISCFVFLAFGDTLEDACCVISSVVRVFTGVADEILSGFTRCLVGFTVAYGREAFQRIVGFSESVFTSRAEVFGRREVFAIGDFLSFGANVGGVQVHLRIVAGEASVSIRRVSQAFV